MHISLLFQDIPRQTNGSDCGVFVCQVTGVACVLLKFVHFILPLIIISMGDGSHLWMGKQSNGPMIALSLQRKL